MNRTITKLFKLRTNMDHYVEFQAGLDYFRFEFRYNSVAERYAITIYKNYELKLSSYFLVWSLGDLLSMFAYEGLGSLRCVSEDGYVNSEGMYIYNEIVKDNVQTAIFRWDYETI